MTGAGLEFEFVFDLGLIKPTQGLLKKNAIQQKKTCRL